MKSKGLPSTILCFVLLAGLLIAGCTPTTPPITPTPSEPTTRPTSPAPAPSGEVYNWTWMGKQPYTSAQAPLWQNMTEAINERSGGQIVIDCFHFGEHPYNYADLAPIVEEGQIEMSNFQGIDMSGFAPILGAMDLPFLFPNMGSALKVKQAYLDEIANPYLEENHNFFVLAEWLLGGGSVHGKRELNSYDACKGQKIRSFNTETATMVTLMGGSPVSVAYMETYSALQQGVIDAAMCVNYGAYDSKWYELVDHTTLWDYFFATDLTIMNWDAFNELPMDLQSIVLDTAAEYEAKLQTQMEQRVYWAIAMAIYDYNVKVHAMDPVFRQSIVEDLDPLVYAPWRERAGAEGQAFFDLVKSVG